MKCSGVARVAGHRSGSEERGGGVERIRHAAALLRRAKHWHGKAQPGMALAMYRTALAVTGIAAALNRIVRAAMGIELKWRGYEWLWHWTAMLWRR